MLIRGLGGTVSTMDKGSISGTQDNSAQSDKYTSQAIISRRGITDARIVLLGNISLVS